MSAGASGILDASSPRFNDVSELKCESRSDRLTLKRLGNFYAGFDQLFIEKVIADDGVEAIRIDGRPISLGRMAGGDVWTTCVPTGTTVSFDVEMVTVAFDANSGFCSESLRRCAKPLPIGWLPVPEKEGAVFAGWFTERGENGERVTADAPAVTGTLYAQWIDAIDLATVPDPAFRPFEEYVVITNYSITYANTKGCANVNPTTYTIEDAISFSALTNPPGWRFVGWEPPALAMGTTGDKVVTALWEKRKDEGDEPPAVKAFGPGQVSTFAMENGVTGIVSGVSDLRWTDFVLTDYQGERNGFGPLSFPCFADSRLVDAEKNGRTDSDDYWCPALADVNLLVWSSWAARAGFEDEDQLAEILRQNPSMIVEAVADEPQWDAAIYGQEGLFDWFRDETGIDLRGGGYVTDFSASVASFAESIEQAIASGDRLVKMCVWFEDYIWKGERGVGHCVTCCGCAVNPALSVGDPNRLVGLFIIDSDNDMYSGEGAADASDAMTYCPVSWNGTAFDIMNVFGTRGEIFGDAYALAKAPSEVPSPEEPVVELVGTNTIAYVNLQGAANTNVTEFTTNDLPLVLGPVEREGYMFLGWTPNGGVIPAGTVTNVTFVAQWAANEYTVRFDDNGGSGLMANETMTYDAEKTLTACAFTRTGYTFAGWATSAGGAVTYADGAAVKNLTAEAGATVTLYAKWTPNEYTVDFNPGQGGTGTMPDQPMTYDEESALYANLFVRAGCEFLGWATAPVGEVVYAEGEAVSNLTVKADGVVTLYAVWDCVTATWTEDVAFSAVTANVYDGCVLDGDYNLVGIVQVKTAKQVVKTTTDKKTNVKTVTTNITATATVTDASGKKWSYSKGVVTVDGAVTGLKCTTKGCPAPEFGVKVGKNGLEGAWGEYAIFGARNGMGTKGDAMMAALDAYKGKWSVTLSAPVAETATVRLQLDVQAKGVVKIAGNWESGAKVSASAQMIMGDGFVYVPVMVKQTKTSPALNALLRIDANGEVALLSEGELVAGGRTVEALGEPVYLPSELRRCGKAFGARVAVNELAYPAKFAAKKLPAGLKIDAATGVISGMPTKPGRYIVEVTVASGLNSKAKKMLTVEFDIANYTNNLIPIKDSYGPYYVGVSADERIAAATGCSVSGLPAGLKWTAKDIKDSKTKMVKTAANTIYGVPTKTCTSTVYFKKSEKELVNGKMKSVTHQASATFIVEGMKPWACGTFNGGNTNGIVTLTVSNVGKISGKWMSEGLTWTLSAASFDAYISSEQMYVATVIGKSGKLVMTNEIEVTENGVSSPLFEAWRNGWKEEPLKTLAKDLKGKTVPMTAPRSEGAAGTVLLTVGASGAVTAKGTFITGFDEKKQKDITYSASCSTVLIPTVEAGLYRVYLYFPPKSGKFDGFSACESVMFAP